jgi:LPS O-antigen subunit length determinant protein (WzzB/FepE family)
MKRNWTFAMIALVAAIIAVVCAFLAGKQWNESQEDDSPNESQETDEKEDLHVEK